MEEEEDSEHMATGTTDTTGTKGHRPKNAYQHFQAEHGPRIIEEMKADVSQPKPDFTAIQKEISHQWKLLDEESKKKYEDMAAADRKKYLELKEEADREAERAYEERMAQKDVVEGSRRRVERVELPHKAPKEVKFAGMDLEKLEKEGKLTDEMATELQKRKAKKAKEAARHAKGKVIKDAKAAKAAEIGNEHEHSEEVKKERAKMRLKYLLSQSDTFTQFLSSSGPIGSLITLDDDSKKSKHRKSEKEEDAALLNDGMSSKLVTRLLEQPSNIKNGQMRPYQLEGLNWMIQLYENGVSAILADEMGLGKTLQTISLLGYLRECKNLHGPHIVFAPKTTLSNWMKEFKRWCPEIRAIHFQGDPEERSAIIQEHFTNFSDQTRTFDVVVTSYEIANIEKASLQKFAWHALIIDEAHRIKNENSKFATVVRCLNSTWRLLITGTPLQNNLHELWALLNFLIPDVFHDSSAFDEWFNLDTDDVAVKETLINQLHRILKPFMLRRLKSDVETRLLPKIESMLYVGMTAVQKEIYKSLLLRDFDAINGNSKEKVRLLNLLMQLRKVCAHPYLFEGIEDRTANPFGEHLIESCGKLSLLDKLLKKLKQQGSRVLIFSQMTRLLDVLEDYCAIRRYKYCRIDGNTDGYDREEYIDRFNAEGSDCFLFLLSTRAGGLGINLQTADVVILYDSDWNPQADLQAIDRAHRIGQKKQVMVYRLVTENSIEEKIIERAEMKLRLDALVIQTGRAANTKKNLSKEEMLDMVQHGASQIFRTGSVGDVTDEDIDRILQRGMERTAALQEEVKKKVGNAAASLLDFSLNNNMKTSEFEGIDYEEQRKQQEMLKKEMELILVEDMTEAMGKRSRSGVVYTEATLRNIQMKRKIRLPKKIPFITVWQMYPGFKRISEITEMERAAYEKALEQPEELDDPEAPLISEELQAERDLLLSQGHPNWTRKHHQAFITAVCNYGRNEYSSIAYSIKKDEDDVRSYSKVFWEKGPELLGEEWDRVYKNIERAESKLAQTANMKRALATLILLLDYPTEQLTTASQPRWEAWTPEEDRFLLCSVMRNGFGNWDEIRRDIKSSEEFRFDLIFKCRTSREIADRVDQLMNLVEKELANVQGREEAIKANREKEIATFAEFEKRKAREEKNLESALSELRNDGTGTIKKRRVLDTGRGGNRAFPEHLTYDLVRYLDSAGAISVIKAVENYFIEHPHISKRQISAKIAEVATKPNFKKFQINPPFVHMLSPEYVVPPVPSLFEDESIGHDDAGTSPSSDPNLYAKKKKKPVDILKKARKKMKDGIALLKLPKSAYVWFTTKIQEKERSNNNDMRMDGSVLVGGTPEEKISFMTKVAELWKSMTPEEKKPYEELAERDRARFDQEKAALEIAQAEAAKKEAEEVDIAPSSPTNGAGKKGDSAHKGGVARPVPEEMLPELAQAILDGTHMGLEKIVDAFAKTHPNVSKRQLTAKVNVMAVKEKRETDKRARWYLNDDHAYLLKQLPVKSTEVKSEAEISAAGPATKKRPASEVSSSTPPATKRIKVVFEGNDVVAGNMKHDGGDEPGKDAMDVEEEEEEEEEGVEAGEDDAADDDVGDEAIEDE